MIAQDIYKELTNEGYRVFFSRISLEDKLGTEYEPYIFAALNSAKVMLVVGTDYENFDAVRVKNEWSRFLKLIAAGQKKTLIPVFKNMDAYDMPKEFARLAAQDMGKVGAMQDLVRGVEKIVGKKKAESAPTQQSVYMSNEADAKTAAAFKRGDLSLEAGEWDKAKQYYEQALSLDAECAQAYFGMALAGAQCSSEGEYISAVLNRKPERKQLNISRADEHILQISELKKIPRYIDEEQIEKLYDRADLSYVSFADGWRAIRDKVQLSFRTNRNFTLAYRFAKGTYKGKIEKFRSELFDALDEHVQKAEQLERKAAEQKQLEYKAFLDKTDREIEELYQQKLTEREEKYQELCTNLDLVSSVSACESIRRQFAELGDYKDSPKYLVKSYERMLELEAEQKRAEEETRRKQLYDSSAAIFTGTLPATIENWEKAKNGFESLGDYRDAANCAQRCASEIDKLVKIEAAAKKAAAEKAEQGRLRKEAEAKAAAEEAERQRIEREKAEAEKRKKSKMARTVIATICIVAAAFAIIYLKVIIPSQKYNEAESLFASAQYEEALAGFTALGTYKDSAERMMEVIEAINARDYHAAKELLEQGSYQKAEDAFIALGDYSDSETMVIESRYQYAQKLFNDSEYEAALSEFIKLDSYKESESLADKCKAEITEQSYQSAESLVKQKKYIEAIKVYESLYEYKDSRSIALDCIIKLLDSDRSEDAIDYIESFFLNHKNDYHQLSTPEIEELFSTQYMYLLPYNSSHQYRYSFSKYAEDKSYDFKLRIWDKQNYNSNSNSSEYEVSVKDNQSKFYHIQVFGKYNHTYRTSSTPSVSSWYRITENYYIKCTDNYASVFSLTEN